MQPSVANVLRPLFVGAFNDHERKQVTLASARADAVPRFHVRGASAKHELQELEEVPHCIVLSWGLEDLESFIGWIRGEARFFGVPIMVEVPAANDRFFTLSHAHGADDVLVAGDSGGLTRRLANLRGTTQNEKPPTNQGKVVIAHAEERRRRVLGRTMRLAGFDVHFADSIATFSNVIKENTFTLGIVSLEIPNGGASIALDSVSDQFPVIVLDTGTKSSAQSLNPAAVSNEEDPADNLLFLANELLRPDVRNIRASDRLLHGTICAFRRAGDLDPVFGLTYNISREGLFVRTLDAPPTSQLLWFEMRPPGLRDAVHLRGEVMWCRDLHGPGGAAPPGFAMRIDLESCPPGDHQAYVAAYEELRSSVYGTSP
ncbi:MAG: PilZ domain-containing protein [Myxococcota bacterium]